MSLCLGPVARSNVVALFSNNERTKRGCSSKDDDGLGILGGRRFALSIVRWYVSASMTCESHKATYRSEERRVGKECPV